MKIQSESLKFIAVSIIFLLIGFSIGFISGTYTALNYAVEKAQNLLSLKGYTLDIDTGKIASLLMRYNFETGEQNALIHNDTRG